MAIELNDNIDNKSPKILDKRFSKNDGTTPYVSVAEANSLIPLSYRALGLPVLIGNVEYWYRDGIQDADLVEKTGGGGHIIQDNNVDLPNQPKLNVSGISLKAEDNNPNSATDLYFTGKVCGLEIQPFNFTFGAIVDFTKVDYVPNVDVVSSGLEITRDDSGEWLFNPLAESQAEPTSPTNSWWYGNITSGQQFLDALANLENLPYTDFSTAVLTAIGTFDDLAAGGGTTWIMKDDQDRYWVVFFVGWTITIAPAKATNYLQILGAISDGTSVTIGARNYVYDLTINEWSNDDGFSFASLVDAINNDSLKEVDAIDDFGNVRVYALNDGVYGNSISTTLYEPVFSGNINWTDGGTLVGGADASGGGGFQYQRAEILVLCNGNISFPDGTSQTTAPSKIQNEGITLPTRPFIDFVGSGVEVDDFGGKTRVTINSPYRKIINVDAYYGDFAKASLDPYNQDYSFPTLETAVAVAQAGDLIFVSAGNYTPASSLAKDGVDWYFCPNAIVTGASPFYAINMTFNVYGYGTFINNGFATPFFFLIESRVNITCNKYVAQNGFYGCVYAQGSTTIVHFTAHDEVDASYNLGIAFSSENGAKLTINSPVVKCSWGAYNSVGGDDTQIIANVPKTIMYDIAGDFTSLGNNFGMTANGTTNALVIINGDLFTEQTIDSSTTYNASLLIHNGGGGTIILNGAKSVVRNSRMAYVSSSANGHIIVLSEIENTQENGVGVAMNTGKVTIKSKLKNADASITESILITGGTLILDGAVLICGALAPESIVAPVPMNYKVYNAYTNKIVNANMINIIGGTAIVVDAGIE